MELAWAYSFISVGIISAVSLVGVVTLAIQKKLLKKGVLFLVSFSAGALLGDAFIHLLPEAFEEFGFGVGIALYILGGIVTFFILEKIIHWRHCHGHIDCHPVAYMSWAGDALHNFIDGLIIGASYLVSIPAGIATTVAVVLHEIPQEIGDFGVLIHGGFSVWRALFLNFLSACTAFLGVIVALIAATLVEGTTAFLVPFAAGSFIYIAGTDLMPELHKETNPLSSALQLVSILLGIGVMLALLLLD